MSCVFPPRVVVATIPVTTPTHPRAIARCAARHHVRLGVTSVAACVAFGLVVVVALVPRSSGAQSTVSVTHSTRHTVRAEVGTVTHTAFLSHQRLTTAQAGLLSAIGDVVFVDRAWVSTVEVRSNVNGALLLEPSAVAAGGALWRVLNADGELVPWTSQAIIITPSLFPGRHTVSLIWVAPDAGATPPHATLRFQSSP